TFVCNEPFDNPHGILRPHGKRQYEAQYDRNGDRILVHQLAFLGLLRPHTGTGTLHPRPQVDGKYELLSFRRVRTASRQRFTAPGPSAVASIPPKDRAGLAQPRRW